jgi:hypothetical protein
MHVASADRERQFWIRYAGVTCSSHVGSTIYLVICTVFLLGFGHAPIIVCKSNARVSNSSA